MTNQTQLLREALIRRMDAYLSGQSTEATAIIKDALAALSHPAQPDPDAFREALQDECDMLYIPMPSDAREAVKAVVAANVRIALDPAVSREALALIDQGKAQPQGVVYVDGAQLREVMNGNPRFVAMNIEADKWADYKVFVAAQPQGEGEAVASIYIGADGSREFDDWKCQLPPGRNVLYTTPPSSPQAAPTPPNQCDTCGAQPASQQAAQAVPEGWQLVPVEPTAKMISAALRDCGGIGGGSCGEHTGVDGSDFADVWDTMLRAAKGEK